jgi:hypothetical protein
MGFRLTVGCVSIALTLLTSAQAATFTTIYKFDGSLGENPSGKLLEDRHGALYGTAYFFGPGGHGVVFRLTPPAQEGGKWTDTVLYAFSGGADGSGPAGGLAKDAAGNYFGIASQGGTNGAGGVFTLAPPPHGQGQWTESIIQLRTERGFSQWRVAAGFSRQSVRYDGRRSVSSFSTR